MNVELETMGSVHVMDIKKNHKQVEIPDWLACEINKQLEGVVIPPEPCIILRIGATTVWSTSSACFATEAQPRDVEDVLSPPSLQNAGLVHRKPGSKINTL